MGDSLAILNTIKSYSNFRLFYEDKEEQGIEYDKLIELSESSNNQRATPVENARERHLISNK